MLSLSLKKYDAAIGKLIIEVKKGLDKTDEILGQIQSHAVVHGGTTRQVSGPKIVETPLELHQAQSVMQLDSYRKTDVKEFVEFFYGMWETFTSQAHKALFELVSQTTEAVGNVFSAEGKNIWDAQIEVLESTEMHFDEEGNHGFRFYIHPDTAKKLEGNPPTLEQQKRMEEVIKAKREEYYAKKRTRRLS